MYKKVTVGILVIVAILAFVDFNLSKKDIKNSIQEKNLPPKDWSKFFPFTGKFTVYLPKAPKYAIDVINEPNTDIKRWYEMYASEEVNGTVFLLNLISYQSEPDPHHVKNLLHNVINELVSSNLNNHVIEIKDGTFKEREAVFFNIENEAIEVKGVAFLAGKTIYQLTYTSLSENFEDDEYQNFINSFELVKQNLPEGNP